MKKIFKDDKMKKKELAILECNTYLRNNINKYLEAFVKFYGEEKRKYLEEKFSKAIYIGYQDIEETEIYIRKLEEKYTKDCLDKELKNNAIENEKEKYFSTYSFENKNLMPIAIFEKFYNLYLLGNDNRKEKFIEEGYNNYKQVNPEATMDEYLNCIEKKELPKELFTDKPSYLYNNLMYYIDISNYDREYFRSKDDFFLKNKDIKEDEFFTSKDFLNYNLAYTCYQKAYQNYKKIQEELRPYKEYINKANILKKSLEKKYYQDYILETSFIYNDQELKEINDYFNNKSFSRPKCLEVLSSSLNIEPAIKCFSSNSQLILDNDSHNILEKEKIIKDRINYFKARGLDLGNNYQDYVDSELAQKMWPSDADILQITSIRERYINDFNNEFYTNASKYMKIRKEITSKNLLDKNDSFDISMYKRHATLVNPNIRKIDNRYELYPLVIIHVNDDEYLDHRIVHELNHLYELNLVATVDSNIEYLCGWDYIQTSISADKKIEGQNKKRNYELFNEAINELIAQDISELMIDNNLSVFNDIDTAKYSGYASYEQTNFLVKDFYNEFKSDILRSRKDGNISHIFDIVGKENFDALNDLFNTFNEHFSSLNYYHLIDDLNNGRENDDTKKFNEIVKQKNSILSSIKAYSENKEAGEHGLKH